MERDNEERRRIFKEELQALKDEKLIDEFDYHRMNYLYNLYVQKLEKKQARKDLETGEQTGKLLAKEVESASPKAADPLKELIAKLKANQQQERESGRKDERYFITPNSTKVEQVTDDKTHSPQYAVDTTERGSNPKKDAEQMRERNITWGLILGVILLFIGGLVFGTSNWSSMNNLVKVIMVLLVSIIFFIISFIAEKSFHISKTAFAFLTLGSLFMPISLISIAFFSLIGPYFSMYGEGRYVFGFISSLLCLSLYTSIAAKYKHRLFVWFTFLTATIAVSFLLAMSHFSIDFFYFGIMLYNALLLFLYYQLKKKKHWIVFTKELPHYTQLNLIVSTLLMLFFFENEIFYSFNILLTAALYVSMVFVNKTKHYHVVFTLLFVYGMYQFIEHSYVSEFDYIGFALIGMLYLPIQKYAEKEENLAKIFRITSGIISFCAFIFISIQGVFLRADEDSFVLLAAYLIISVNYLILANMTTITLFRYLTPIFLMTAVLQSYYVLLPGLDGKWLEFYLFTFATVMFVLLYLYHPFKYMTVIRKSSFAVSIITMLLTIFLSCINEEFTHTALLLFAFGVIALITYTHAAHLIVQSAASWANPASWGLALITAFDYVQTNIPFYRNDIGMSGHMALSGILLLGVSYFWKKRTVAALDFNTFITGTALYTLSMCLTPFTDIEHPSIVSAIYFGGIVVYLLLFYKMRKNVLWLLVSMTTLFFFLSLSNLFEIFADLEWRTFYHLSIPLLLLFVYEWAGRKIAALKPYFLWTAHGYLMPSFLGAIFTQLFANTHPATLLPVFVAYLYSALRQTKEWAIKLFLYAAFTTIPIILYLHFMYYQMEDLLTIDYLFLIVTALLLIVWRAAKDRWKRRIEWYVIPQAIIGLLMFLTHIHKDDLIHLALFALYALVTLFLLHKRNWQNYTFFPLSFIIIYLMQYVPALEKTTGIALVVLIFFIQQLYGYQSKKELIKNEKNLEIDWYTITAPAYVILLLDMIAYWDSLWLKLIPSVLSVYYLFMLINRCAEGTGRRIVKTAAIISLLWPYYTILVEFEINQYLSTELVVLPLIVLTIFLSRHTWQEYQKIMNHTQTIVLCLVTVILVIDALESNTIYDALIIGLLSLISIIGGMQYRMKSYFFIGIAVLLLNVLLQTRPFWGNFPWWGYLVIAGLTLISFAGFNEWQKQKKDRNHSTYWQKKKEQVKKIFKDWD